MTTDTKHFRFLPTLCKNVGRGCPHPFPWFIIAYCMLFILFFSPIVLTGHLLAFGDAVTEALPAFASRFTLWTNALFAGFPAAADPENQFWYPLRYVLPRSTLGWNLFVLAPYVLASSCAYGYQYQITRSRLAAAVTGTTFAMSGFMIAKLGHVWIIHAAAWLPLIIWAFERLRSSPSVSGLTVASVGVANSVFAGSPQICTYSLSLTAMYVVFRGWKAPGGCTRYYVLSAGAMVLGLSIAAIQLIPAAEFARLAARWKLSYTDYGAGSFPLHQSIALFFPFVFGGSPWSFYNRPYCGYWNLPNLTGYVGLLPLMLAVHTLRHRDPVARFWVTAAIVTLVLALGSGTPVATLLFYMFPYNKFRVPARHFMEWSFALSVLAGQGVLVIQHGWVSVRRIYVTVFAGAVVMVTLPFAYPWISKTLTSAHCMAVALSTPMWRDPSVLVPWFIFILSATCLLLWSRYPRSILRQMLLLSALLMDLGSFGFFCQWRYGELTTAFLRPPRYAFKYQRVLASDSQRMVSIDGAFAPYSEIPPNLSWLWHLPSASGYDTLVSARMAELLRIKETSGIFAGEVGGDWWSTGNRTLDVLAVRYVFAAEGSVGRLLVASGTNAPTNARWRFLESHEGAAIVENLRAAPRAWLVPEVRSLSPSKALEAIQTSRLPGGRTFDPLRIAVVEEPLRIEAASGAQLPRVQVRRLTEGSVELFTMASSQTFLVLSDAFYPGWQANIDGEPAHIFRTDYALRGLVVPAGYHKVYFEFCPKTLFVGSIITVVALLILGTMSLVSCLGIRVIGRSSQLDGSGGPACRQCD